MATVYSKLFVDIYNAAPSVTIDLGTPPPGTKWVIKHMVACRTDAGAYPVNGFRVVDYAGVPIWLMELPFVMSGLSYNWEGTQILEEGQHFSLFTSDSSWSLRVSGHELTLP
jgi:hypothetical protein